MQRGPTQRTCGIISFWTACMSQRSDEKRKRLKMICDVSSKWEAELLLLKAKAQNVAKKKKKKEGNPARGVTPCWSLCLIKYEITLDPETFKLFKKSWATLQTSRQLFPIMCRIYESHGIRCAAVSWHITAVTHASDRSCWWNTRSVQWNVPVDHLQ